MTTSCELQSLLLDIVKLDADGALGLLEAITKSLNWYDVPKEKLVGLTTDSEAANSGRHQGLWTRLRALLNWTWYPHVLVRLPLLRSSHRERESFRKWNTTLAVGCLGDNSLLQSVEVKSKLFRSHLDKMYRFPEHFDVRFAKHLNQIIKAVPVLHNFYRCCLVWEEVSKSNEYCLKTEANGFLKKWKYRYSKFVVNMTALMGDAFFL